MFKNAPEYSAAYLKLKEDTSGSTDKIYVVTKNRSQYIGLGNATEVFRIVLENLPANVGPARTGNTNDQTKH
jgi:hypothetical protein